MSAPDFQCKPTVRLQKPISLQYPNNHIGGPLKNNEFHEVQANDIRNEYELVFDPCVEVKTTDGPRFSGDFECGNIGQVYRIGEKSYEIHLLPDPNDQQTTQWFFFKVENLEPGEYFFCIVGFYRQCNLHWKGSQPCVYSENAAKKKGIGWQRIGDDMNYFKWKSGKFPEWAWSFRFSVKYETDNMYFAHAYPYTFTDLNNFLNKLHMMYRPSVLCQSVGEVQVPAIFWDADIQKTIPIAELLKDKPKITHSPPEIRVEKIEEFNEYVVNLLRGWKNKDFPKGVESDKKPVCIIVARTHPGESNSSYAMEGLLECLFTDTPFGKLLRESFSWLLVPMINPDGVICGFYRPDLSGDDMNRIWPQPDPLMHPIASTILDLIEILQQTRPIAFFLDFHGHTAACNSFVYGFMNEQNPDLYSAERVFPLLMTKYTPLFSNEMCSYLKQKQYEGTMRVTLRRRFLILFAYTLEMSYGGCDFGPRRNTQFTPHDYRSIGKATAHAIVDLLLQPTSLASREAMLLLPFSDYKEKEPEDVDASIEIDGTAQESKPQFFNVSADDIKSSKPEGKINLVLKRYVREVQ